MSPSERSSDPEGESRVVNFRELVEAKWKLTETNAELWRISESARPGDREATGSAERRAEEAEAAFRKAQAGFETRYGQIVDHYFCRTVKDAGTALTIAFVPRLPRTRGHSEQIRTRWRRNARFWEFKQFQLHTENLVVVDFPDEAEFGSLRGRFAELFHKIRAKHTLTDIMLRGWSRHVLIVRLFALRRDMLAEIDKARHELHCDRKSLGYNWSGPVSVVRGVKIRAFLNHGGLSGRANPGAVAERLEQALADYEHEYQGLCQMYRQAAKREARIIYLKGMLIGLLVLAVLSPALGLGLDRADLPFKLSTFVTCIVAGAVGAFVSVLQRMSAGKFTVNHEVGREYVSRLGFFRPLIGSIFGLAAFFAFISGFATLTPPTGEEKRYAFFAFVAFLAGFSERFTKEIVGSPDAEDTEDLEPAGKQVTEQPKSPSPNGAGRTQTHTTLVTSGTMGSRIDRGSGKETSVVQAQNQTTRRPSG